MSLLNRIPKTLEFYPDVAKKIDSCWDTPEGAEYIRQALSKDRFRDRLGFNFSVWFELKELLESSEYNQTDFSKEKNWRQGKDKADFEQDQQEDDFKQQLGRIQSLVDLSQSFTEVMPEIEPAILNMLKAVRITVFQCARNGKEMLATFKSSREKKEIRVPFSPTSIAGYVALNQKPVLIKNLYQEAELKDIHPKLRFERSFSENSGFVHRTMICVPIKAGKILLGVLQIINRTDAGTFSLGDVNRGMRVAQMIADKFQSDLQTTQGPFDKLLQQDIITLEELEKIETKAHRDNCSISGLLLANGISEKDLGVSLEQYYQVPYLGYQENLILPQELFSKIRIPYLRKNLWLPIGGDSNEAVILLDDPGDGEKISEIQRIINAKKYVFRVGTAENILRYLGETSHNLGTSNLAEVLGDIQSEKDQVPIAWEADSKTPASTKALSSNDDIETLDIANLQHKASWASQQIQQMIADAVRLGGSYIHLEAAKENFPGLVSIRVGEECQEFSRLTGNNFDAIITGIKTMAQLDLLQHQIPQEGKFRLKVNAHEYNLRVAIIPTVNGESAVLHISASAIPLSLKKLNLSAQNRYGIENSIAKSDGLFLLVGPRGSGKTTILHALLEHLIKPEKKIWTAEEPVEIVRPGVQQVQVNPKIGFNMAAAVQSLLGADPDCILIDELTDQKTIHMTVQASLSGHFVLSTLLADSAIEGITRLLDLGIEPIKLSYAVQGILAQRLVHTLCNHCKQAYQPSTEEIDKLAHSYGQSEFAALELSTDSLSLYQAIGCKQCGGTGYRGRIGVHELLLGTETVKKLIYKNASSDKYYQQVKKDGMKTLLQDGILKILNGDIDYQQLMKVCV